MILDKFKSAKTEIVEAIMSLGKVGPGVRHIDLGSGDGKIVHAALQLGASSYGIEIDPVLAQQSRDTYGITVLNEDCFNSDVSKADVITCWFTLLPETQLLMDKLYKEMKQDAILIKGGYTQHHWKPIESSLINNFTNQKEVFQGENILRIAGEIICIYKK